MRQRLYVAPPRTHCASVNVASAEAPTTSAGVADTRDERPGGWLSHGMRFRQSTRRRQKFSRRVGRRRQGYIQLRRGLGDSAHAVLRSHRGSEDSRGQPRDTCFRVTAVTTMRVEDYFEHGKRARLRLHEKGGKRPRYHHNLTEYLDGELEDRDTALKTAGIIPAIHRRPIEVPVGRQNQSGSRVGTVSETGS